jgi:hypothetical protein
MMITNKILIEEVDELKNVFSRGEMEIPSFWYVYGLGNCCCMEYDFAIISVGGGYLSVSVYILGVGFPRCYKSYCSAWCGKCAFTFLSVPRTYRNASQVYQFISRKGYGYALVYMALILRLHYLIECIMPLHFLFRS